MAGKELNGLKRYLVSVAVVMTVALLTQTGALIWWCSETNTRMNQCDKERGRIVARIDALEGRTP